MARHGYFVLPICLAFSVLGFHSTAVSLAWTHLVLKLSCLGILRLSEKRNLIGFVVETELGALLATSGIPEVLHFAGKSLDIFFM